MNEEILGEFNYRKPFTFKEKDTVLVTKKTKYLAAGDCCVILAQQDGIVTNEGVAKGGNYYLVYRRPGKKCYVHESNLTFAPPGMQVDVVPPPPKSRYSMPKRSSYTG